MRTFLGFTLLEILVSITIMTILTVGGIGFFQDMNRQLAWKKLTAQFEQDFWKTNTMTLTQTSSTSGDQPPQSQYLYFEAGDSEAFPFVLDHLTLEQRANDQVQESSFSAALITFEESFASLHVRGLSSPWSPTEPFPNVPVCDRDCSLIFFYSRPGSEEKKTITIDSEKHFEFSF